MEKIQKKLSKFSNVIFVFAKIGFIASIVGVCISVCAMTCFAMTGNMSFVVELGNEVNLHGLLAEAEGNAATVWGSMTYALLYCICLIVVMRLLMRVFANMRDNYTPFTMENAHIFEKVAICMIVAAFVPSIVGQIVGELCAEFMNLSFTAEFADSFSLIAVLILYTMSMVFKYGCALQEQADTTL